MKSLLERYGPCAVVTGASSGIGEAFARELAAEGFELVLVARRRDRLDALAAELSSECAVVVADLSSVDFASDIMKVCEGKDVGLVISNAGDGAKGSFEEIPLERKLTIIDVNCRAPMILAHEFLPRFKVRGSGGFIITSSIESVVGFPYSAAYAASKSFATSLGEGLWGELEGSGVDVLVVEPGATDTEILAHQGMRAQDMMGLMQPVDVARVGLSRLGRGPVVVAGRLNRLLVGLLALLPRGFAVRMAGKGMLDSINKGRARD
ncbi:MAG: short-subunit dehydrogenase [Myxococcota bacterium]|jgi:short-subunit dehydrogenase